MSAQRFIRCRHCGMPHEAQATSCPITGQALVPEKRRVPTPPRVDSAPDATAPAPESYQWAHSIHPYSIDPSVGSSDGDGVRYRDASALIGRVIEGKYRIDALIGRGGMGVVYRAENIRIGRHVAIKILLAGHARGSESERRFLREARIAGSIGHPNICEVTDLGTLDDGAPFQVMELLEGQTLAQRIRLEGAMPIDEVLTISEQVLSALSAAHGRGIVHRDLKPDNVFLHDPFSHHGRRPDEDGSPTHAKLLDFGVSKSLFHDHTLSLTQTGMVVGTPYYLAPEQARGDRGVDHRADLWAMGVVMYEALTGTLPFRAENYNALIVKILQTRPALPSTIRPQLPAEVEAIVMRALAYAPSDRFTSADHMLATLRMARGRRGSSSERAAYGDVPERPLLAPPPLESTLSDLRISVVQGPEDPTEISETFVYSEVEATRKKG